MAKEIGNFTNDSAMMLAYERALETSRPDALFQDPFAKVLAGEKGKELSDEFGVNVSPMFKFDGWHEFHKTWAAVRTKFIDDCIGKHAASGKFLQLANLGAGFDTRAYRLESYKAFTGGSFEVDMKEQQANKVKVFTEFLGGPTPHCPVRNVDLDFLDTETTLIAELQKQSFDAAAPTIFVAEGLVMYLGDEGKFKLIKDVSAAAAPGSIFILQFLDGTDAPEAPQRGLLAPDAEAALKEGGWEQLEFSKYGDEKLNFGRYPSDRFKPKSFFSFVTCVKSAA